ncbi:MAG TPA: B-box zinc finger protein [Terriglobia bacterium]|nr:B-box zinc finger protein [Terriglobia bacterium]
MLRTLLKVFGTLALVWLGLWLLALIAVAVAPKAVNAAFADLIRFNYVGAPATLIWGVLKVVSALKASRAEPPISLAVSELPRYAPTGGVLSPPRAVPVPEAQPVYPPGFNPASTPAVYTYSAPGLTGGVLSPERAAPTPETPRASAASSNFSSEPGVYTYSAPGMPMCPQCGERPAIFYCLTHRQAACLQCVAKHDQPAECFYLPAFRAPKSGAGR